MTDRSQVDPAKINLRKLDYSPSENPFLSGNEIKTRHKTVRTKAKGSDLVDTETGEIVGCATGSALTGHHVEFAEPLVDAGIDLSTTFYFGESVLLPTHRGHGIGHAFFDVREAHALAHGYKRACFCAVDRPADHPLRPESYSALDPFWTARGYSRLAGAVSHFDWPETPDGPKIVHRMDYWTRSF